MIFISEGEIFLWREKLWSDNLFGEEKKSFSTTMLWCQNFRGLIKCLDNPGKRIFVHFFSDLDLTTQNHNFFPAENFGMSIFLSVDWTKVQIFPKGSKTLSLGDSSYFALEGRKMTEN